MTGLNIIMSIDGQKLLTGPLVLIIPLNKINEREIDIKVRHGDIGLVKNV